MDVEVVHQNGSFKILEIDARLPSQTPSAVYWSTGRNMIRLLGALFVRDIKTGHGGNRTPRGTVYEHIRVCRDLLEVKGEHIMTEGGILHLVQDFFGADEAITNFDPQKDQWVATLIVTARDRRSALAKKDRVIEEIIGRYSLKKVDDSMPVYENRAS